MFGVDRKIWGYFKRIARPFFYSSESRWKARGLFGLLIGLAISINGINVLMSYMLRDFMTALSDRQTAEFFRMMAAYVGCFLLAIPVVVFTRFCEEKLVLLWRRSLAEQLLERYFSKRAYYKIKTDVEIDNPDQRITDDVRAFTGTSVSFMLILFNSLVTLVAFLGVLISISWTLGVVVVAYAGIGSLLTVLLGRRLIGLNLQQIKREADLRYNLVHLRDNAESIAFYHGESHDLSSVKGKLYEAITNFDSIIGWTRNLGFFTTGYNYFQSVIAVLVVAPLYLAGSVEFGVVTQAPIAFGNVLAALSIIISQFERLSGFIAVVTRLGSFTEAIQNVTESVVLSESDEVPPPHNRIQLLEGDRLAFENVTLVAANSPRILFRDLSFELPEQDSLVIVGPSGAGKTSVLRATAGIWSKGEGTIIRPPASQLMFLPQSPYLVVGTLRAQLLYPARANGVSDSRLESLLEDVKLDGLLERVGGLDREVDWLNILSLGEQQKIGFARVLLSHPSMVFLDESTTALDVDAEEHLYRLVQEVVGSIVSVGHRASLFHHHQHMLELIGDGRWRFKRIGDSEPGVWI